MDAHSVRAFSFDEQLSVEARHNATLDAFFANAYDIEKAGHADERRGIDRWFTDRCTGWRSSVQYKADTVATRTHNAFIETISVDKPGTSVPGWAHTCMADWLFYYVPGDELCYCLRPDIIRARLANWRGKFRSAKVPNKCRSGAIEYHTHGLLVPLCELEACADEVVSL